MDSATGDTRAGRPNILLMMCDQLRYPPPYESAELAAYRREHRPPAVSLAAAGTD